MTNHKLQTSTLVNNTAYSRCAVVIPVRGRLERFYVCLNCVFAAIAESDVETQIVVMDNADSSTMVQSLTSFVRGRRLPIHIDYLHCPPPANQSVLRNTALTVLDSKVEYVLFVDSDIYLSRCAIRTCMDTFESTKSISALSVPMAPYLGGKHQEYRDRYKGVATTGPGLSMPSKYDYEFGKRTGSFLETLMLRGVYMIRRDVLHEVFGAAPWHRVFMVWQNVPFFLTLRDAGYAFGCILESSLICLHDERWHPETIAHRMRGWHAQTIKSLVLLAFRNKLWLSSQRILNERFVATLEQVAREHAETREGASIENLSRVALCLVSEEKTGRWQLHALAMKASDSVIRQAITFLLTESWSDIHEVKSLNLTQSM